MAESGASSGALLERYAGFYAEVARIKQAIREGRLPVYLAGGQDSFATGGNDLAALVSQRLATCLLEQYKQVRAEGTKAQIDAYRNAQYAMAAQADELFILDLEWAGREAWPDYLLERTLFNSASAGRDFFVLLDGLLRTRAKDPLQEELATVLLMALQLGFKGQHRGAKNAALLDSYRRRLVQFIGQSVTAQGEPAFAQAYRHRLSEAQGQRLAPLRRWYYAGAAAAAVYLALSTIVWFVATRRLEALFGGG